MRFDDQGRLTFICSNCLSIIKVSGVEPPVNYVGFGGFNIFSDPYFHNCPACSSFSDDDVIFEVDPEIAEDILIMNKKGYKTYACCSSHSEFDTDFYVLFTLPEGKEDMINEVLSTLPEEFMTDPFKNLDGDRFTSIRVRSSLVVKGVGKNGVEYLSHKEWEKRHQEHLKVFHNWVINLMDFNDGKWKEDINIKEINAYMDIIGLYEDYDLYYCHFESDRDMKPIISIKLKSTGIDEINRLNAINLCRMVSLIISKRNNIRANIKIAKEKEWEVDDEVYSLYADNKTIKAIASKSIRYEISYVLGFISKDIQVVRS